MGFWGLGFRGLEAQGLGLKDYYSVLGLYYTEPLSTKLNLRVYGAYIGAI